MREYHDSNPVPAVVTVANWKIPVSSNQVSMIQAGEHLHPGLDQFGLIPHCLGIQQQLLQPAGIVVRTTDDLQVGEDSSFPGNLIICVSHSQILE